MSRGITIAVMAGGESRRMGRDKAQLPSGGGSLLERIARAALSTGCPVIVVGRSRPDGWPEDGIAFHADRYPGKGPLGGIATALEATGTDILALACDMPLLTTDAVTWLLRAWHESDSALGLTAEHNGDLEPLFSVYGQAILPAIRNRLAGGPLSVRKLLIGAGFPAVPVPEHIASALTNVNTPEEWAQAIRVDATP